MILKYQCALSENYLEIRIDTEKVNLAYFDDMKLDAKKIKLFVILLRKVYDDLKTKNIERLQYLVTCDDWNNVLSNSGKWTVVSIDSITKNHIIECKIDDYIENISNVFL